ncbi:MAG: hypothetical protein EAZ92_00950 [Candidatus Kapaibacterium sp.]|nr:MAG: hypothetical protein EAZ92_00950 [Candidatus Kapabacteria bacterium]
MNLNGQSLTLGAVTNVGSGQFQGIPASNLTLNGAFTNALIFQIGSQTVNNVTVNIGNGNALNMGSSLTVRGNLIPF